MIGFDFRIHETGMAGEMRIEYRSGRESERLGAAGLGTGTPARVLFAMPQHHQIVRSGFVRRGDSDGPALVHRRSPHSNANRLSADWKTNGAIQLGLPPGTVVPASATGAA